MIEFMVELFIANFILIAICYYETYLLEKRLKKFNENNNLRGKNE